MRVYNYHDRYYRDFTDLYMDLVGELLEGHDYEISPRGMKINEIVDVAVVVDPKDCHINFAKTKAPERQEVYDKYCKAELEWYLSGNTLASSAPSKFWNQLASEDGHITSNYGHMMLHDKLYPQSRSDSTQFGSEEGHQTAIDRIISTLTKDADSRQAIAHYNQPRHCYPENKDFPCTVYSQFFLRDNVLAMTTYQRSCDIIKGFSYDVPWNCFFMNTVFNRLKETMPNLKLGSFTHVFGSLHLYEKDFDLARRISVESSSLD